MKINEFREIVFSTLGYKLDINENSVVSLLSVFAFSPSDQICFKKDQNSMILLESEFIRDSKGGVAKEVEIYYKRGGSIPALLAGITLSLWEKTTIQVM